MDYKEKFMAAVYPEASELAWSSFNEQGVLTDAADLIMELKAEVERLREENERLKAGKEPCPDIEGHTPETRRITREALDRLREGE